MSPGYRGARAGEAPGAEERNPRVSVATVLLVILGVLALVGAVALIALLIRRSRANAMWDHVDTAINKSSPYPPSQG